MIPFLTISTFNHDHWVILVFCTCGLLRSSSRKMSLRKITQSVGKNFIKMAHCNFALHYWYFLLPCYLSQYCAEIVTSALPTRSYFVMCHATTQKQLHVCALLGSVHCSLCTWLYGAVLTDEQLIFLRGYKYKFLSSTDPWWQRVIRLYPHGALVSKW